MRRLKLKEICAALGCLAPFEGEAAGVVWDSRKVTPGCLFVAIEGENFDGHDFAPQALEMGALAVVAQRPLPGVDPGLLILAEDTRRALVIIAGLHRDGFGIPFVGITGSVGKTSTKEFASAVLSTSYVTHKNFDNLNNEIGVAQALLELKDSHGACIIEMGMSHPGDIAVLSRSVRPDIGIITSIGVSHMQQLGSREAILSAKAEITEGMDRGGALLVCSDSELLKTFGNDRLRVYRYGACDPTADIAAENIKSVSQSLTSFDIKSPWGRHEASIPALGSHNVANALAAFAAGCLLGIIPERAAAALFDFKGVGMRQKTVSFAGMTVVEDCYNASPDSMRAAARTLAEFPCAGRRILIAGDMLELGEAADRLHFECGGFIAGCQIDALLAAGDLSERLVSGARAAGMRNARHFGCRSELLNSLLDSARPGDVLWFKASRSVRLEEIIEEFYKKGAK